MDRSHVSLFLNGPRLTILRNLGLQSLGPRDIWTGDIRSKELGPRCGKHVVKGRFPKPLVEISEWNLTRKDWIGHL